MPVSASAAAREINAVGDTRGSLFDAVVFDHPLLNGDPVRLVNNYVGDGLAPMQLPLLQGGPKVPFTPCGFDLVWPGQDESGQIVPKLAMDFVSGRVREVLRLLKGSASPLIMRPYQFFAPGNSVAAITGPLFIGDDWPIKMVSVSATRVEASVIEASPVQTQAAITKVFDRQTYPGLYR